MNYVVFWIGSTAISFGCELYNTFRIFKDAADLGFKINREGLGKLTSYMDTNAKAISNLTLVIPGINLLEVLRRTNAYNSDKHSYIYSLQAAGALEFMNEKEKKYYYKNPSMSRAIMVAAGYCEDLEETKPSMNYSYSVSDGHVDYELKEDGGLKIVNATGSLANITEDELKSKISEGLAQIQQDKDFKEKVIVEFQENGKKKTMSFEEFENYIKQKSTSSHNNSFKDYLLNIKESIKNKMSNNGKTL